MPQLQEKLHKLSLQGCFSDDPHPKPVPVISIYAKPTTSDDCQCEEQYFVDPAGVQLLSGVKSKPASMDYTARLICLSQSNSFRRLNITRAATGALMSEHQISPAFLDIASCFFLRTHDVEEAFCAPFQYFSGPECVEYMYVFKCPEETCRDHEEPWSIRQVGLYHQVRLKDKRSTFVLITAYPKGPAKDRVVKWLTGLTSITKIREQCFHINQMLLSRDIENWRAYMRYYELEVERLFVRLLTASEVTSVDFAQLSATERRIVPLSAIFASTARLYDDLNAFEKTTMVPISTKSGLAESYREALQMIVAYQDSAAVLSTKCSNALNVLNSILNLNNQRIAQQQNDRVYFLTTTTVDDSATVRVITAITLVFLSFTAIAAVMAMPLFYLREADHTLASSPSLWIYFAVSIPLTVGLLAYWRFMLYLKRRKRDRMLKTA